MGSFTLQNMAALFPRLLSAAASFGVKGEEGLAKFGAFLQIARKGAGNSEQAATAVERVFSDLIAKYKEIKGLTGFMIFDPEKSKKEGRAVTKDLDVILKEIIKRTKGDVTKLQKIFGEESIRAINGLALSFRTFGDFREFDRFAEAGGDGAAVMKDFAFWSGQTEAKLRTVRTQISKFSNENLAGPIEGLTRALDYLEKHPAVTKGGLWALLGLAGAGMAIKGGQVVGGLAGGIGRIAGVGGKKGAGELSGSAGGLLGGAGPVPVYVVNKHLSLTPDQWTGKGPAGAAGAAGAAKAAKAARAVSLAGKVVNVIGQTVAMFGAGYAVGALIEKTLIKGRIGEGIYDMLHPDEGQPSVSGPGADVAARRRKERQAAAAARIGDLIDDQSLQLLNNQKTEINMNVRIDPAGRVTTDTDDLNTRTNIRVKRGRF